MYGGINRKLVVCSYLVLMYAGRDPGTLQDISISYYFTKQPFRMAIRLDFGDQGV